jgi:hypothetical protein
MLSDVPGCPPGCPRNSVNRPLRGQNPYSLNLGKTAIRIWTGTNTRPSRPKRKRRPRRPSPEATCPLSQDRPMPPLRNAPDDPPSPVAPSLSRFLRNSVNRPLRGQNPYSLNLGKTAIRIWTGTADVFQTLRLVGNLLLRGGQLGLERHAAPQIAPSLSRILRNSGNQPLRGQKPYSLNLGTTAIRIWSGTPRSALATYFALR